LDTSAEKRCQTCKLVKPLSDFNKQRTMPDGHRPQCRACQSAVSKKLYAANPEKIHHRARASIALRAALPQPTEKPCIDCHAVLPLDGFMKNSNYADGHLNRCKACCTSLRPHHPRTPLTREEKLKRKRERNKQRRAENPEKVRAEDNARYHRNPMGKLKSSMKWFLKNRPKVLKRFNQRRILFPEKVRREKRLYAIAHPEVGRRGTARYRAHFNNVLFIEDVDIEVLGERDHWKCHICHKRVQRSDASVDHFFPVSRPGSIHGYQYVALAHKVCNSKMGAGRFPAQLRLLP
jgi:hypothetical protein